MRFIIKLENRSQQQLPVNYQYPLSAWIYRVFNRADSTFAEWLHHHGYSFDGNRRFKLFAFSGLQLDSARFSKSPLPSLIVPPGTHRWVVSFMMEEAAGQFIKALFTDQELSVGAQGLSASFNITGVEQSATPVFGETVSFGCLSPVVISKPRETASGRLIAQYLPPDDKSYSQLLHDNLLRRYIAAKVSKITGIVRNRTEREVLADLPFDPGLWQFNVLSNPRSRLQTIKEGTEAETKIKGFMYDFEITAPPELLQLAYNAGLGEKGSLGFGCINEKTS